MTISTTLWRARLVPAAFRPAWSRAMVYAALAVGGAAGLAVGWHASAAGSDVELSHLLRAMAVLKLLFVAAAAGAILWRLQAPVTPWRLAAYATACAAMAAGPGLIWFMAYVAPASILLHGGVAAAVLLLWRDEASSRLLELALHRRRARR